MKRIVGGLLAALCIAASALAQGDLKDRVDQALKKSTPQEIVAQLEREDGWGNVLATYHLGLMYRKGEGVPKDPARALAYFTRAGKDWVARYQFKLGVPGAQYEAGLQYLKGEGTTQDAEVAAKWLRRAAEQGHGRAQLRLAEFYATDSPGKDMTQAFFWASVAGNQFDLGKEEKEAAAAVQARARGAIGAAESDRVKQQAEGWSPRRML
ncbi:MAG: tetratricopeptide repeat protein [Pseudomonadota bacterium]